MDARLYTEGQGCLQCWTVIGMYVYICVIIIINFSMICWFVSFSLKSRNKLAKIVKLCLKVPGA